MENIKVLNGLMTDGITAIFLSYELFSKKNTELMLAYLNQANTFFTNAKTVYYSENNDYKCTNTEQILYKFGELNEVILKSINFNKDSSMEEVKILFEELDQLVCFSQYS